MRVCVVHVHGACAGAHYFTKRGHALSLSHYARAHVRGRHGRHRHAKLAGVHAWRSQPPPRGPSSASRAPSIKVAFVGMFMLHQDCGVNSEGGGKKGGTPAGTKDRTDKGNSMTRETHHEAQSQMHFV